VYFGGSKFSSFDAAAFEPDKIQHSTRLKMRKDPMIALGLWTIKSPCCTCDFTVKCEDPVVAEFIRHIIQPQWTRMVITSLNMLDFGWQVHEKIWAVEDIKLTVRNNKERTNPEKPAKPQEVEINNAIVLKRLKDLDPSTVVPIYDIEKDEFVGVEQRQGIKAQFIEVDKLYIPRFNEEWGSVVGKSILDNAYRPWYYAYIIEQLWARFMERRAIPPVIGYGPLGKRQDSEGNDHYVEDLVLTAVNNIHHGNGGYMPFEPDSITRKNMWGMEALQFFAQSDQFETFMAKSDARMLRGLLIPEKALIQGTKVGTLSETEQFTDTFLTGLDVLLFTLEEFINAQIIAPMLALNFAQPPKARLVISQITAQRRSTLKDLVKVMMDATDVNSHGVEYTFSQRVDMESAAKQMGIPLKDPDEILQRKPQTDPNVIDPKTGQPYKDPNGPPKSSPE